MRLAVINPNSTVSMTEKAVVAAQWAAPGATVLGITCHKSPAAIQGPEDDAICRPFVLTEVARAARDLVPWAARAPPTVPPAPAGSLGAGTSTGNA